MVLNVRLLKVRFHLKDKLRVQSYQFSLLAGKKKPGYLFVESFLIRSHLKIDVKKIKHAAINAR